MNFFESLLLVSRTVCCEGGMAAAALAAVLAAWALLRRRRHRATAMVKHSKDSTASDAHLNGECHGNSTLHSEGTPPFLVVSSNGQPSPPWPEGAGGGAWWPGAFARRQGKNGTKLPLEQGDDVIMPPSLDIPETHEVLDLETGGSSGSGHIRSTPGNQVPPQLAYKLVFRLILSMHWMCLSHENA